MSLAPFRLALLLTLAGLGGCTNEGRAYALQHTELSAAQRQILSTGKIPAGNAVAGLTHDQVKLAMKGFPTSFDRINGEEAWVYLTRTSVSANSSEPPQISPSSRKDMPDPASASDNLGPAIDVNLKTTVYFQGDRATHAEVTQEKL